MDANGLQYIVYEAGIEGKLQIVASSNAKRGDSDQNKGRYIRYTNRGGEEKYISLDSYKKILRGTTARQDINAWLKSSSENIAQDKSLTEATVKREAVSSHVRNYLSDPKVLRAAQYQLGSVDENGQRVLLTPTQVQTILEDQLMGTKGTQDIKQDRPLQGRQKSFTELTQTQAAQQRKYNMNQALQSDVGKAEAWMDDHFSSRASKYGAYKDRTVESVTIEGKNMILHFDSGTRKVPNTPAQIHNLMNEFTYTSEAANKLSFAQSAAAQPNNFGAAFGEAPEGPVSTLKREPEIDQVYNAITNTSGSKLLNKKNMKTFVDNIIVKLNATALTDFEDKAPAFEKDHITFLGNQYNVSEDINDVNKLLDALDSYVKELRGTSQSKGVDEFGVPIE